MKRIFLFLFLSSMYAQVFSQAHVRDSLLRIPFFSATYSYQLPGGNMKARFGANSNIGLSLILKTKKNYLASIDYSFIFGSDIKENGILDSIKTSTGFIIDGNGQYAETRLFERGFTSAVKIGKLLPYFSPNKNSGFMIMAGIGLLQHKIRIEDIGNRSPQLSKTYKQGYDRLTNGLSATEFIGYVYLSNNRLLNLMGGFEFTQAFTQSRRSYNFDTMERDTKNRLDLLSGIRLGLVLPLFKRGPQDFYFD